MGYRKGSYRVLVGRPEGKGPLGISRRRYENNIKMHIQKTVWEGMESIDVS